MISSTLRTNWRAIAAGIVAAALVGCLSVGGALAYFTTYAQAEGSAALDLGSTTRLEEEFDSMVKQITIANTGEAPCFVRVKAFSPASHPLEFSGSDWTSSGEWWYYGKMLMPGERTTVLGIAIADPQMDLPDGDSEPVNKTRFDVVVVHENTIISNAEGTAGVWPEDEPSSAQ